MKDKNIIYEVKSHVNPNDSFKLKTNSIYKLIDKFDSSAPSGFIKENTTKLPSEGVGETIQANYVVDPVNPTEGLWDTGFYEYSPCYKHQDKDEIKIIVDRLDKYVVQGYKKIHSRTHDLGHEDDSFWSNKNIYLYTGRAFNTGNPNDLLDVYIALQTYSICPEGSEGDPRYAEAAYVIVDYDKNTQFSKIKASQEMDAIMNFGFLLTKNIQKLYNILYYEGLNVSSKMDEATLKYTFKEYLKLGPKNAENFNKLVEQVNEGDKVEEKIFIYRIIKQKYLDGTGITKRSNGKYYFKDMEIGADLKGAAGNIVFLDKFKEIKVHLLES